LTTWDFEKLTLAAFYYHPGLDVARAQWGVAKAAVTTAGGRPNPTVGVVPEYNFNASSGVSPWLPALSFDLPIETAGKRGHRIARAQQLSESARLNIAAAAMQVRANLRARLLEYEAAKRRADLLEGQRQLEETRLKLLEQRVDAGALAQTELTPPRVALIKTRVDSAEARRQAGEARFRIAEALGLPRNAIAGVEFRSAWDLRADTVAAQATADARRQALQRRPDLLTLLAEYAAGQSALQLEIARQYPDVHLGTGYQWDQGENKWSLGLTMELPLLNRNQGPIAEAEAKRTETTARFVALQAKIIAEIDQALGNVTALRQQVIQTEALVQQQRTQLEAVQSALLAGAADQLELQNAQLELRLTELAHLESRIKEQQARGQLEDTVLLPAESWPAIEQGRNDRAAREKP
jgi:outer membrane protein TolC